MIQIDSATAFVLTTVLGGALGFWFGYMLGRYTEIKKLIQKGLRDERK